MICFLQELQDSGMSPSTVVAIAEHHNTVVGISLGSHKLIIMLDYLSFFPSILDRSSCPFLNIVIGLLIWFSV